MKKISCLVIISLLWLSSILSTVAYVKNIDISTKFSNTTNVNSIDSWIQSQKLIASDGTSDDFFGWSVSLSGDTALIGAVSADGDAETEDGPGAAYVFIRNGTIWTQQAKLISSDRIPGDHFGCSVSLDGDTALIGAYNDHNNKGVHSGSAYVFKRSGTTWNQEAKLLSSDGTIGDGFGYSVSLYSDYALIGAHTDDDNGEDSGSAFVFKRSGTTWNQEAKLLAIGGNPYYYFGYSVSIYGDYALIGAPWTHYNEVDSGLVYVFKRSGTTWNLEAHLVSDESTLPWGDYFGYSVSLYGDYALIGAISGDGKVTDSGTAYVFKRNDSIWIQQQMLTASDGAKTDCFGCSVSLNNNTALIGAFHNFYKEYNGSAYVFTRDDGTWIQQQKLTSSDTSSPRFGWSVCLNSDTALIGSILGYGNEWSSGCAYVFTKNKSPDKPTITGNSNGKVGTGYEYTFVATDPEGDEISYFIDWGDNNNSGWLGPYSSGKEITAKHNWTEKGNYTIKAKVKDTYGAESDWATFEVNVTKSKGKNIPLFIQRLIQRFSFFEKILKQY